MKKKKVGLIAQEVEEVVPEVVSVEKVEGQELKSVRYENIVALLIEGMKELNAKLEAANTQIENLKQLIK